MTSVAIIDYGMSNLHSVQSALQACAPKARVEVARDSRSMRMADRLVFPGQGAASKCMQAIQAQGLDEALKEAACSKPMLGICMGLQVLLERSEENDGTDCLGIIQGEVKHLSNQKAAACGHKIPHLGWNRVRQQSSHPLWDGIADQTHFYFVHSYYAQPRDESLVMGSSDYPHAFSCALAKDGLFAVQFHPEKSGKQGLQLIQNFINWKP